MLTAGSSVTFFFRNFLREKNLWKLEDTLIFLTIVNAGVHVRACVRVRVVDIVIGRVTGSAIVTRKRNESKFEANTGAIGCGECLSITRKMTRRRI